ncbi:MAG: (Fe-S)-binding protein [Armatimonadota bacterium]|jgi:ArsR family metal-binding transcriptional regulator
MLVDSIEITHVLPCFADPSKIRIHARPSADLTDILPYLNAVLQRAIYHHAAPALTLTREHRIICVHPQLITGAKIDDAEDARVQIEWLREAINETWARRGDIEPRYDRREKLTPLPIFKLLPGTNCRECGVLTCLAFAVEMAGERASIMRCSPLFTPPLSGKRNPLVEMLADAGYEVPSVLLNAGDRVG